eukprot:CAMPEP_0171680934 /NCGR_PEP_ID=MMETSP0990-20121206/57098_1 /TAXON_ID=483369 /ORGANISM="non described non described, Strain CCMP2098" /LENGTH=134 /DNA_ID=CAMNT_0012267945 /DNA_START=252 /DNA_END=656 /DNA_ORIENTATION=-
MEILSSQAATLGGWCRAHADAVEDNGPRCVKALEWCATASEMHSQQQQRRQQGTPASPASPASLPSASPPPVPPPLTELPKTKDGDGNFMAAEVVSKPRQGVLRCEMPSWDTDTFSRETSPHDTRFFKRYFLGQ